MEPEFRSIPGRLHHLESISNQGLRGLLLKFPSPVQFAFPDTLGLAYLATGIANSAPLAMLSGQRCMTLLQRV